MFLPCSLLYPKYSISPDSWGAKDNEVTLLLLPQCLGSRVETQVHSHKDNLMTWIWQETVHPPQPTPMAWVHHTVLCLLLKILRSVESLVLDVKLLRRKGHNLTKLAHSAPQNSTFQSLVIRKPSHDSSSVHGGRDCFPIIVPNNNNKPKKPLHRYKPQQDQPDDSHCSCRAGGKQHFIRHLLCVHNREQGRGFSVVPDGLASTTGAERRRDFCSSASQELQRLFHSVAVTHMHIHNCC